MWEILTRWSIFPTNGYIANQNVGFSLYLAQLWIQPYTVLITLIILVSTHTTAVHVHPVFKSRNFANGHLYIAGAARIHMYMAMVIQALGHLVVVAMLTTF